MRDGKKMPANLDKTRFPNKSVSNMVNVEWPNPPYPPKQTWDQEAFEMAEKWQSVRDLILELIPEEGEKIGLSVKQRNPRKLEWMITPVPLPLCVPKSRKHKVFQLNGTDDETRLAGTAIEDKFMTNYTRSTTLEP